MKPPAPNPPAMSTAVSAHPGPSSPRYSSSSRRRALGEIAPDHRRLRGRALVRRHLRLVVGPRVERGRVGVDERRAHPASGRAPGVGRTGAGRLDHEAGDDQAGRSARGPDVGHPFLEPAQAAGVRRELAGDGVGPVLDEVDLLDGHPHARDEPARSRSGPVPGGGRARARHQADAGAERGAERPGQPLGARLDRVGRAGDLGVDAHVTTTPGVEKPAVRRRRRSRVRRRRSGRCRRHRAARR